MKASKSALIIMHCQNDIVDPKGLYSHSGSFAEVSRRGTLDIISKTLAEARAKGVQIFYVNNKFSEGYPELGDHNLPICTAARTTNSFLVNTWGTDNPDIIKPQPGDIEIINTNTSAFSYTTLDQILRAKGITELYLGGVATNFVVESTARYGSELGYNIHVVEDCCASWTQEMHEFAIQYTLPQYGEVTDSATMLASLE
ncbi:MAG: cysteine hydrolase [Lachnospiraceae bacterium]|nr:cysteine hydrolase [Lachnospiraceae bacterium]